MKTAKNPGETAVSLMLSNHATTRARQRGIREFEIPVIVDAGTLVNDSVLLLNQDVDREIRKRKQEITILERLRGCRVVIAGETIVTIYRPSRKTEKRLLRGQHRHRHGEDSYNTHSTSTSNGGYANAY